MNDEYSKINIGDVLRMNGKLMVCDQINDCAARMRPLTKKVHVIKPRGDAEKFESKPVKFVAPDITFVRVSPCTPGPFVARLGINWINEDFASVIPDFSGEANVWKEKKTKQQPAPAKASEAAPAPAKPAKVKSAFKGGKCAFLTALLEKGEHTREEMVQLAVKEFGGTLEGTRKTISAIPGQMRKAGKEPKWRDA